VIARAGIGVESLLKTLQGFGIGRLAAILGGAAGVAAILVAVMLKVGEPPMSLLYSNLDLKEAGQITAALDQAGVKYVVKGDGSTIMVDREKVANARLMLSGKGLPTSGSMGYEIFDNAPALGQTDFMQTLNAKRATEGELARTIRSIQGVQSARVLLNLPKKQLFEDDAQQPSASIMLVTGARRVTADQVRAIRNLVAAGVPDLKTERVAVADQSGDLLAGMDDAAGMGAASAQRGETEERLRKTLKDLVEGVVGPGKARVTVSADLDLSQVTTQEEKYDPDGQVVRSTRTTSNNQKDTRPGNTGAVSVSQNLPGGTTPAGAADTASTTSGADELTNYEISRTTKTTVDQPGRVKKLSVAVAVDGVTAPTVKGKPGVYTPRAAEEMSRIQDLVRSAMGYDKERGDELSVVNVRFERPDELTGGASAGGLNFDKNDIMRAAELGVLFVVAALLILFVARPILKNATAPKMIGQMAVAGGGGAIEGGGAGGLALPSPSDKVDIAKIDGQVSSSTVRQMSEFVERHPEESVAILRSWLHEA
jgi:flagellar M-ring protein FliF